MKVTYSQNNFTRGEVTPLLQGRTDAEVYKTALLEATNATVIPHGPVARRKGTTFISEVKNNAHPVRLIRYRFTSDTSYILEFGNNYIRFYTERGQVLSGGLPLELSSPYSYTEVQDIQHCQVGSKLYLTHQNHAPQVLERLSALSWTLGPVKFYPQPTFEDGYIDVSATMTPGATTGTNVTFTAGVHFYQASMVGRQIVNLSGTGRASIVSITDPSNAVCTIVETFPSTATMPIGTWKLDLSPITTITPSGTALGSIITLTAAATAWKILEDVGKYLKINGGVVKITEYVSETVVKGEVQKTLNSSSASNTFSLEVPSWSASRGFPRSVAAYEQRLFFGGSIAEPVTVWGSSPGDFSNFGVGSLDDDPISFDLNNGANISWMSANRELIIGGESVEVSVSSGQNSALTPTAILQRTRTPHGSDPQQPLELPNEVLFVQKSTTKLRSLIYDYGVDSYGAEDLSLIASHIFDIGVLQTAYAQNPYPIVFSVLSNGSMASMTYLRQEKVLGSTLISTDGTIENVATVPNGGVDDVYIQVLRTINGVTKRYIEVFSHDDGTLPTDVYSDCTVTHSNPKTITGITKANPGVVTAPSHGFSNGDTVLIKYVEGMTEVNNTSFTIANVTTNTFELQGVDTSSYSVYTSSGEVHKKVLTISGLSFLEGKTVQIKSDGATHPNLVVSSGSITLQDSAAEVTVGLPYTTSITTLPVEFSIGQGPTMYGQRSRHPRPVLKVYMSAFPFLNGQLAPSRNTNDLMDTPVPLYTGDIEYGPTPWGNQGNINVAISNPFPLILIGIFGTVEGGVK